MRKGLLVFAIALALPATAAAQLPTREVQTGDDFFTPENVSFDAGSTLVHWGWATEGLHNVRQDEQLFYSGPVATSGDFSVVPSAGTFGYFCELHGFQGGGMAGEIRAKPTAAVNGSRAQIAWANPDTNTGTQFDVRQKVGKKKPRIVEEKTKDFEGSFKLKDGKNQFQVRSRQGNRISDWSPKLNLKG